MKAGLSPRLSPREVEILTEIATGKSRKEVAAALYISIRTVDWHIGNIYQSLEASNATQAIATARAAGLIPLQHIVTLPIPRP